MTIIEDSIEKFKKIAATLYGEETKTRRELDGKIRRLETLKTEPLPLDDFIAVAREKIDEGAHNSWPRHLSHILASINDKPMAERDNSRFNPLMGIDTGKLHPGAITFCMQDTIADGVERAIQSWDDYPTVVGGTRAERKPEIAKLERDIPRLQDRLEKIIGLTTGGGGHVDDKYLLKRKGRLIPPPR